MRRLLLHLGLVPLALLFTSTAIAEKTTVKVLIQAPPRVPGCPLDIYRDEKKIATSFEKLCTIKAEFGSFLETNDQTGVALKDARARACLCGANAILILSNSSDTEKPIIAGSAHSTPGLPGSTSFSVREYRKDESVTAVALRVSPPPPPPMPPNEMKAGFRDLAWGASLTEAFVPIEEEDPKAPFRRFVRAADELLLAKISVTSIRYLFAESKLSGVAISFPLDQWPLLKENLSSLWGTPQRCEEGAKPSCTWWTNMVDGAGGTSALLLEGDSAVGTLVIGNPELMKQARRGKKEAEAGL
ncbi:MAG: hypothetical protein IPP07_15085 [Holophagales bacterium]|nr:hypothetical protein [Holophagales bacterium]